MTESRSYYTLVLLQHGRWSPQFGDYDRETVDYELEDYVDQGYKRSHLKVIVTGHLQADVNSAVANMNRRRS